MGAQSFPEEALASFAFLGAMGFTAEIDSASRVHYESARIRVNVSYGAGRVEVVIVLKRAPGPHNPSYYLGEVLRWKGLPVPAREARPEELAARLATSASQLSEHGSELLAGSEEAFEALDALRASHGHLYAEEHRQRAAEGMAVLARMGLSISPEGTLLRKESPAREAD